MLLRISAGIPDPKLGTEVIPLSDKLTEDFHVTWLTNPRVGGARDNATLLPSDLLPSRQRRSTDPEVVLCTCAPSSMAGTRYVVPSEETTNHKRY